MVFSSTASISMAKHRGCWQALLLQPLMDENLGSWSISLLIFRAEESKRFRVPTALLSPSRRYEKTISWHRRRCIPMLHHAATHLDPAAKASAGLIKILKHNALDAAYLKQGDT